MLTTCGPFRKYLDGDEHPINDLHGKARNILIKQIDIALVLSKGPSAVVLATVGMAWVDVISKSEDEECTNCVLSYVFPSVDLLLEHRHNPSVTHSLRS